MNNLESHGIKHCYEAIISLRATGRQLYKYIRRVVSPRIKSLFFKDYHPHHDHAFDPRNKIHDDDSNTLLEIGIKERSEIISSVNLDHDNPSSELSLATNQAIMSDTVRTRKDIILMEELFDNITEGKQLLYTDC